MNRDFTFSGKLAIQQRVLPAYRASFFDMLAGRCLRGLGVFSGNPLPEENVTPAKGLAAAQHTQARNINFLRTTSPIYQCWQANLIDWLENWQPDVLIVESNPRTVSNRLGVRWMHARGRPVFGWGLGLPPLGGWLKSWREWTRRSLLRSLDGMIAYSQRGAQDYVQFGFAADRIFIAPNAVASKPAFPLPERQTQLTGPATVLFVGRLQARKRIDSLLQACAALDISIQPRLVIVGDGPARADFEACAREFYPAAEFTGALYADDLQALFLQADLFVLPGTGGLAVQQAMAYGLPVIVAEGDGTQDDLVRPENGWLLPADDQFSLERSLEEALSDVPGLRQKGAASYRIVSVEANLENMVTAFAQAAESVLHDFQMPGKSV